MLTDAAVQKPRKDAAWYLGVALFGVIPAILAFACSEWFPYGSPHFSSGLWFFYEASRDTAYLGIVLATILTVAAIIQQAVSRKVCCSNGLVDRRGDRLTLVRDIQVSESVVMRQMVGRWLQRNLVQCLTSTRLSSATGEKSDGRHS